MSGTSPFRRMYRRDFRKHHEASGRPLVALTFDDGPSRQSAQILEILQQFAARATFFVIGERVDRNPGIIRGELDASHLVGNHTYTHANLKELENGEVVAEMLRTQIAIEKTTGLRSQWFRPPFGSLNQATVEAASSLEMMTVLWSVDPRDWLEDADASAIREHVLKEVEPGAIVLMHDGANDSQATAQALPGILEGLASRDYVCVTLEEMRL